MRIVPRDEKFFDQIEELSSLAKSCAQNLNELVRQFPGGDGFAEKVSQARENGSQLVQSSLERLGGRWAASALKWLQRRRLDWPRWPKCPSRRRTRSVERFRACSVPCK